ncbi:MAG: hypothetical protein AVDCRST_MAG13-1862 [uncultured Solirubrobacteraceae bacterium]|uniref:DUF72 domain-containing protein n=1 Tax=uncultured Solirubrobacteraceae bacterium TaxID=1162706 RepID=A0A6J4SAN1_9ACTN|nr:MAG: hypothetical protein AVDCRST_MAG13-1862 [uncultured Solirubrobacteraceae bacterium]
MPGRIVVGTSSWTDPGFVEEWYPAGLPARDRLAFYAERFEGVEVNATWYAVPAQATVRRWVEQTPPGFTFDVKLHRLLSGHATTEKHLPRDLRPLARTDARGRVLPDARLRDALVERFLQELAPLTEAGRLASLLLQLSPAFEPRKHALDELAGVLDACAPLPVAIELRHKGWLDPPRREDTLGWMEAHGAAFVAVDVPEGPAVTLLPNLDAVTRPDLAYLRLHGRAYDAWARGRSVAERFAYVYSPGEVEELAGRARGLAEQAEEVRVEVNTNRGGDAPVNARALREALGQDPGPPVPPREPAG